MAKKPRNSTHFRCQNCGASHSRWLGRCGDCGEWNTLVEEKIGSSVAPGEGSNAGQRWTVSKQKLGSGTFVELKDVETEGSDTGSGGRRYATGMKELDRVLGGGLLADSFTLLGGDPGIGKSTLMLQIAPGLTRQGLKVFYVSGEESVEQIASRARRLGVGDLSGFYLEAENRLESVHASIAELRPNVVLLDSLQVFSSDALESAPGSVGQVREIAASLMSVAKGQGIAVILIGHVTKDGAIAGPKVVEHMVDTVLYFEGDTGRNYRLLRAVKNRFGNAQELGVFEMTSDGLCEVDNPSALFLNERMESAAGTSVAATLEGSRPLLVEMQALVSTSHLAMPRRTAVGLDGNRIALLSAIVERHMGMNMGEQDLFFNVAGGLRISEPACDLAAVAAIWSAQMQVALPPRWVFMGEVGLTGEVRHIPQADVRIEECRKLGFDTVVMPKNSAPKAYREGDSVKILTLSRVADLPALFT